MFPDTLHSICLSQVPYEADSYHWCISQVCGCFILFYFFGYYSSSHCIYLKWYQQIFSRNITGDTKPSIRALSDAVSTAALLLAKMVLEIIKLHPFHLTKINPAFVTRQWAGKYGSSTARRSGAVSPALTDTSIHTSSPGRKEAWEWNVAAHHEPVAWTYGKKGDPKHSSASLNARHCCSPRRKSPAGLQQARSASSQS